MKQLTPRDIDLQKLARLAIFSWLKPAETGLFRAALKMSNFDEEG
jgi:hypothetical protein